MAKGDASSQNRPFGSTGSLALPQLRARIAERLDPFETRRGRPKTVPGSRLVVSESTTHSPSLAVYMDLEFKRHQRRLVPSNFGPTAWASEFAPEVKKPNHLGNLGR